MPCWVLLVRLRLRYWGSWASSHRRPPCLGSKPGYSPQRGHTTTGQTLTHCLYSRWHWWDLQSTGDSKTGPTQGQWGSSTSSGLKNTWEGLATQPTQEAHCSTLSGLVKMRNPSRIWSSKRLRMGDWLCWPYWATLHKGLWQESGPSKTCWTIWQTLSTTIS